MNEQNDTGNSSLCSILLIREKPDKIAKKVMIMRVRVDVDRLYAEEKRIKKTYELCVAAEIQNLEESKIQRETNHDIINLRQKSNKKKKN